MTANKSAHDIALEINSVLAKDLQANLRCAICCSTLKNPVVPSCNHPFCKDCIDACFQRKTQIECPMCRQQIKRRSCVPSESLNSIVQAYLQLARAFKRDLAQAPVAIPKENAFLESQAILSTQTDSPMRDFAIKPNTPVFARPRPKRKQLSGPNFPAKLSKLVEENEDEDVPKEKKENDITMEKVVGVKRPAATDDNALKVSCPSDLKRTVQQCHSEIQCTMDPDLSKVNITHVLQQKRQEDTSLKSDIEALFSVFPGILSFLVKEDEKEALCRILNIRLTKDVSPSEQRFSKRKESGGMLLSSRSNSATLQDLSDRKRCEEQKNLSFVSGVDLASKEDEDLPPIFTRLTDSRETPKRNPSYMDFKKVPDYVFETGNTADPECVPGTPSITPIKDYDENKENRSFEGDVTLRLGEDDEVPGTPVGVSFNASYSSSSSSARKRQNYVISVSRLQCQADEDLIHEFRIAFPTIQFSDEVTSDVSHLVMMNAKGRVCSNRSLKYAFAVAHRCELLGRIWLEECLKNNRLVSTAPYTLQATSQSQLSAWQRSRVSKTKLFIGKKFFLPARYSNHHLVNREKLQELIVVCGGEILSKLWDCHPPDTYIVFAPDSKEIDSARRYEFDTKVPVVNADWILDSVSEFRIILPLEKYRVYSGSNGVIKY